MINVSDDTYSWKGLGEEEGVDESKVYCLGSRSSGEHYEQPALKADVDSTPRIRMDQDKTGGDSQGPGIFCSKMCAAQFLVERSSSEFPVAEMPP